MKIYLVGGAVRDEILGYPIYERDYVVVGATPEEMQSQGYKAVGKDFPVFLHPETKEEYALARKERKTGNGYTGFSVDAKPNITLEEDLLRRDLTINAIAKAPNGEVIDPHNGVNDIKLKSLRHVSPAFREDPVRILRVARFAARYHHLGFTVATETLALMEAMVNAGETDHLVAERIWKEFSRALGERSPQVFLHILRACGALNIVMPEINTLITQHEHSKKNPLTLLTQIAQYTQSPTLRFASILHDLKATPSTPLPHAQNAPHNSAIDTLCKRISAPNTFSDLTRLVSRFGPFYDSVKSLSAAEIVNGLMQMDVIRKPERFLDFLECNAFYACAQSQSSTTDKSCQDTKAFLIAVKDAMTSVEAKHFIAQGIQGKALGEAISEQRINLVEALIKNEK